MVCSLHEKSEIRVVKVSHHYMRVERTHKTIQQTVLFVVALQQHQVGIGLGWPFVELPGMLDLQSMPSQQH